MRLRGPSFNACFQIVLNLILAVSASEQWALIMDAGSSGTRIYAYRWRLEAQGQLLPNITVVPPSAASHLVPKVKRKGLYSRVETQPGLDAFARDPLGLESRSLQPLLAWARAVVPPRLASCTPLFLLATAGMRKQSPAEQHAIMGKVREVLQYSGFRFEAQWARVMEGAEEGAAGWVSLNYQHHLLQPLMDQVVAHPAASAGQAIGQDGAGRAAASTPAAAGLAHQQPSHVGMRRQHAGLQQWEGQEQQAESVRRPDEHPGSTPGSGRSARPNQGATSPTVVTADRDRPAASAAGLQQTGGSRDITYSPPDAPMALASSWAGNADGVGVEVGIGHSAFSDNTHGILDLGGSSLKVTFYGTQSDTSVPQSPIALGPALHTHTTTSKVLVGWSHLHLTSHTLTGFGLTDTFDRGVAQLLL
ncbi:nucleoside phosphatase family-domain-containing protein, partial [Haematococcus lacustris]